MPAPVLMTGRLIKPILGLLIGAFFIWLTAKDWPLDSLLTSPTFSGGTLSAGGEQGWSLHLWGLAAYFLILTLIHVLRVARYKPLVDPLSPLDWRTHNRIGAVGFMAIFLFPLRLGEFVRPFLIKRATADQPHPAHMSEILATVVVERVLDGLIVSLFLFAILGLLPSGGVESDSLQIASKLALAVFVGTSLVILAARWKSQKTLHLVETSLSYISRRLAAAITRMLSDFLRGLSSLRSLRDFWYVVFITLLYWGLNGLGVWVMLRAFSIDAIDMLGAYAMMACAVVGMMIPNSPGNVGTFWYFLTLPAPLYGLDMAAPEIIAFGLVVWFMQLAQQSLFGLYFIATGSVSWRRIVAVTQDDTLLDDPPAPLST